jgi:disulfide bond formation protein DsbB
MDVRSPTTPARFPASFVTDGTAAASVTTTEPRSVTRRMSTESIELLTALLTVLTAAVTVALLIASIAARRDRPNRLVDTAVANRSLLVAIVTTGSMIGSLYFSEVANYVPCTLCWYQRIAMYSLALVSVTAVIRKDDPRAYMAVLAGAGASISTYHWLIERFPDLDAGACSATLPCTLVWFEEFGFITLSFMALCAFAAVLAICIAPPKEST